MAKDISAALTLTQACRESYSLAPCYTLARMGTIEAIRRQNLITLKRERCEGKVSKVADVLDRSPSQISQWINASIDPKSGKPRSISSPSARHIERCFGLQEGELDSTWPGTGSDQVSEVRENGPAPYSSELDDAPERSRVERVVERDSKRLKKILDSGQLDQESLQILYRLARKLSDVSH